MSKPTPKEKFPPAMNGGEQTDADDARVGETHRRGIDAGQGDRMADGVRPPASDEARQESVRRRD